jgi:hypothetical protein
MALCELLWASASILWVVTDGMRIMSWAECDEVYEVGRCLGGADNADSPKGCKL